MSPTESRSPGRSHFLSGARNFLHRRSSSSSSSSSNKKNTMGQSASTSKSSNPFAGSASTSQNPPADAPPAYTALPVSEKTPFSPSSAAAEPPAHITRPDDVYAFLAAFDTVFLIDDSGSMLGASWREVRDALHAITPICTAHDSDGIDVYFLNNRSRHSAPPGKGAGGYYNITSDRAVDDLFASVAPTAATPTGTRLQSILRPYTDRLARASDIDAVKPVNIIVITDGRATDDPESVIVQQAAKLDRLEAPPSQVGIQFFQVGGDSSARSSLQELDDDLASQGIRDIVDTVTWDSSRNKTLTADGILKVVLGAVVRRLDRKQPGRQPVSRS